MCSYFTGGPGTVSRCSGAAGGAASSPSGFRSRRPQCQVHGLGKSGYEPKREGVQTCVRWSGGSVVDVTFATPAIARRVEGWRVETEVETLSDHRYIRFEVSPAPVRPASSSSSTLFRGCSQFPRWALSKLNRELAEEAAIVGRWSLPPLLEFGVDEAANRLCDTFTAVCRAAMPRAKRLPQRRVLYWWSAEIAGLRAACNGARRQYTRSRRRRPQDVDRDDRLRRIYVEKRKILQQAIYRAKEEAWLELVGGLE
ncbi:uncharacterized protein LOC123662072, partial [Melitaea cinxia]|uniref:uncharacterized protein LOC123662072 n=1 Tax=Melitaea cinxia TaxID=113334 RepID=UPI001E274169